MSTPVRIAAGLVCLLLSSQGAVAQPPAPSAARPKTFSAGRAASAITIDGVLDEKAWQEAANVPVIYEWAPGDNTPSPVRTDCLVTYDTTNLYAAFRAFDPRPVEIRAHLMDRDDTNTLVQDDHVGLLLDTFNDERRGFEFRVNPLGVQADAIFSEQDGVEDFSWDMIWKSAARITADGYVVEIALPLKQLRFQTDQDVQTWGIQAIRSWPRTVRHRLASHRLDRNSGCMLCQADKITGLERLAQGRNLEFDPTTTYARTENRQGPDDPSLSRRASEVAAGFSARWSLTPSVTFNGAVRPDFSQIEADVAQLDVNQRFALFYPEKRPFFLEGVDFFTTPLQAVFTRTVADPAWGAKLTGKQGSNAVGMFVTRDRINNLMFPSNQGSDTATLMAGVTTVVGRVRRDVGRGSTVGALYAGREGDGYHNRQIGADAFWRVTPSDTFRAQFIRSDTRYPGETAEAHGQPAGAFGGNAFYLEYLHQSRRWIAVTGLEWYDKGFRSDSGFFPRVDMRDVYGEAQRRWQRGAGSWFNVIGVGARAWRTTDDSWALTDETVAAFVNYTGPYQTRLDLAIPADVLVVGGVRYEYWRPNFVFGVNPNGNTSVSLTGRFGGGVDFANRRRATSVVQVGPTVEYRPVSRVSLGLQYNLEQLSVEGGRLYRANLAQFKAVFHLNVRTFVRATLQYTDISRDPSLYTYPVEPRTRRLFSQYLFSYKFNPQTVLFLGYSDNAIGGQGVELRRQDRTIFAKLGYALVL